MAIPHCSVKTGRAGKGVSHALYVQGLGRYGERSDVVHVEHDNMPAFAVVDPMEFWAAADANERANGRSYREVEFAIPRELATAKEQIKFARNFTDRLISFNHAYTLAIHDAKAADGGRNVHGHLMFTERKHDAIERDAQQFFKRANPKKPEKGGAAKDRALNSREFVKTARALYEDLANRELAVRGAERISMARNEDREPEPKLGPRHPRAGQDLRREARLEVIQNMRAARAELKALGQNQGKLESQILELNTDLAAALAEREALRAKEAKRHQVEKALLAAEKVEKLAILSLAELKAHSYAAVVKELKNQKYETSQEVNTAHGRYTGTVILMTDFHIAQNAGRQLSVVHDRTQLQGEAKEGQNITIQYASGRGQITDRSNERGKDRGRSR
ncbi:MobA/MobL family protein [Caballeronia sordidicola]|nr:MobA/MobL family protein [Caballeronia sordidicola]